MRDKKDEMKLRGCYDKNGNMLEDAPLKEYAPLRELLEMFDSVHLANASVPLEKVG